MTEAYRAEMLAWLRERRGEEAKSHYTDSVALITNIIAEIEGAVGEKAGCRDCLSLGSPCVGGGCSDAKEKQP